MLSFLSGLVCMKPTTAGLTTPPPCSSSIPGSELSRGSVSVSASRLHLHCWKGEGGKGGRLLCTSSWVRRARAIVASKLASRSSSSDWSRGTKMASL